MDYRILLVEDEAAIRKFVKINLEKEGYLVNDYESAEEALEACKEINFDIAVLDIMLVKMDGITLLKICLLYTSPSPRDRQKSRMPSSA